MRRMRRRRRRLVNFVTSSNPHIFEGMDHCVISVQVPVGAGAVVPRHVRMGEVQHQHQIARQLGNYKDFKLELKF